MADRNKPSTSNVSPGMLRLRWVLGLATVGIFYACFFFGVYLDLQANQIAVMALGITCIPAIALWLTFLLKPASKEPKP